MASDNCLGTRVGPGPVGRPRGPAAGWPGRRVGAGMLCSLVLEARGEGREGAASASGLSVGEMDTDGWRGLAAPCARSWPQGPRPPSHRGAILTVVRRNFAVDVT